MNYALIKNNIIENIIVADYTMANMIAQRNGYIAVNCDNYPVAIGDLYENGSFMNAEDVKDENGNILIPARTVIERRMTDEEYIYMLENQNKDLGQQVTDRELENLELGQLITDLELRILELEAK